MLKGAIKTKEDLFNLLIAAQYFFILKKSLTLKKKLPK